jgi:iron complex outermembrane receptor protein
LILLLLCGSVDASGQLRLSGKVSDADDGTGLPGVNINPQQGQGTSTDDEGNYKLELPAGNYEIIFSYVGYSNDTVSINLQSDQKLDLGLKVQSQELGIMVVSGSFYEKALEREVLTVDIISPTYIEQTQAKGVDEVIQKIPGVYLADGQANMRGGTGYSYGVGSRVMMVVDDQVLLSADRGDVKWTMLPLETIEQVEVIKGASSVLYGASALNGVVHVRTAWPTEKPQTKLLLYQGFFDKPARDSLAWWESSPVSIGGRFSHMRKIGKFDLVIGGSLGSDQSYNYDEYREHARFNFKTRYRPSGKDGRLSYGLNGNITYFNEGLFLLWEDYETSPLMPLDGTSDDNRFLWASLDPWLTYFDKSNNRHNFKGRYYQVSSYFSESNHALAFVYSGDYQFMRKFPKGYNLTVGSGIMGIVVNDDEFVEVEDVNQEPLLSGDQYSVYMQADKEWGNLSVSAGLRWEYFNLDTLTSVNIPVFRAGLNYRAGQNHFLRMSFGQGYRFPSVAERLVDTEVGPINIFPNPDLNPEVGWNAEIGSKQTITLPELKGYIDLAAFWTEYSDMTEFTFDLFPEGLGFKNLNVGETRIAGLELTTSASGNIGKVPLTVLGGYTYAYPADLSSDTTLRSPGKYLSNLFKSFNGDNEEVFGSLLRYRFRHVAKIDIESGYGPFKIGADLVYFSFMDKIDSYLELLDIGIEDYRAQSDSGDLVMGMRTSWDFPNQSTLSFQVRNLFNREYSLRPGRLDAPRTFTAQYRIQF